MSNNKTNVVFDEHAPEPQDSSKTLMGCLLLALVPVLCVLAIRWTLAREYEVRCQGACAAAYSGYVTTVQHLVLPSECLCEDERDNIVRLSGDQMVRIDQGADAGTTRME